MSEERHYKAVVNGRRSKAAGEFWEEMIERACNYYSRKGIAEIEKTPEPMKPIKAMGQGRFVAYYEKRAQPDYKGTLFGGCSVVFEAKHTDGDALRQSAVTPEQEKRLDRHAALGAECFVMVSFRFERFFKIPWVVFKNMKDEFGRKYVTEKDLPRYEIPYEDGILKFL